MPPRLAAKPKSRPVSRATLDAKLAEAYSVSPRTIRLWRRKGAPLDDAAEMTDWIADLRRQGKADGADVRAAKMRKLTLQIEALEITEQQDAAQFIPRERWQRLVAPMFDELRQALRRLLIIEQPAALACKSGDDVRAITTKQYGDFCARICDWTKAHGAAWVAEGQQATVDLPSLEADETAAAPKTKSGRVADPEMEALRLRKLTLECQALDRENRATRGDLLPREATLEQAQGLIGQFRSELRLLLNTEQPSTFPGRQEDSILDLNRKTLKGLYRRLNAMAEKLLGRQDSPVADTEDTTP